ncbi:DNA repair exonuclease [Caldibacillus lycopersici]|uniref:DNA repair exonuclease n=1 Tax=Perspicuibacillus lycopersici TaxID=1325689 RepID=A0AAE3LSA2_9BACI|nr:DNA repair exonuclease [Perspicuibacillus lycopersici]MCU9612523.1 DNA repair exonuclease [Perspicuibacillus lycopersici]
MKGISFIHCADLHLDSPFVGLKSIPNNIFQQIQQSTFQAFRNIVDFAIERQVDFIIIAGDLYDGEDRSIRAQILFRNEMERLEKEGIPVFIVHGNHDHLNGSWTELQMPKSVVTFGENVEMKALQTKRGESVHLYGFSYKQKHVSERMIEHYQKVDGADYHIGILHGHDSQNPNHYSYAPFKISELLEKNFDYWALGHIHKRAILYENPMIIYPGNIQGRHKKENGEKGFYSISLNGTNCVAKFIPAASVVWETCALPNKQINSFDELYQACMQVKNEISAPNKKVLLAITIDEQLIAPNVRDWLYSEEFLSLLQEGENQEGSFVWIYELTIKEAAMGDQVRIEDSFFTEIEAIIENLTDIGVPLAPLYSNPKTKKYIQDLTLEDEWNIKRSARAIIQQLLKG